MSQINIGLLLMFQTARTLAQNDPRLTLQIMEHFGAVASGPAYPVSTATPYRPRHYNGAPHAARS